VELLQPVLDFLRHGTDWLRHFVPFLAPLVQVLAPVFLVFRAAMFVWRWTKRILGVSRRQWPLRLTVKGHSAEWKVAEHPHVLVSVTFVAKPLAVPVEAWSAGLVYTMGLPGPVRQTRAVAQPSGTNGIVGKVFVSKAASGPITETFELPLADAAQDVTVNATLVVQAMDRRCTATIPPMRVARPRPVGSTLEPVSGDGGEEHARPE